MLQFRGSAAASDAGLLAYRVLDDALGLGAMPGEKLVDARTSKNGQRAGCCGNRSSRDLRDMRVSTTPNIFAKDEWRPGELYPRVGLIVTNMARPPENAAAFYNKRAACERWIKEGKGATRWTRPSLRTFVANAVRLRLHAFAYNLGNSLCTLATREPIKDWSLTSLKES